MGNEEDGKFEVPQGMTLLPQSFVQRVQAKLGQLEFQNTYLEGHVAALETQLAKYENTEEEAVTS